MVHRKAKTFAKDAYYAVDSNTLRDRMNRCADMESLLDMELSNSRIKQICGVASTKDDKDLFDDNYLTYLLELQQSVRLEPIQEHEADPEYVMFLEHVKEHEHSYTVDGAIQHGVPIEEDVPDPQYLMFLENLKEHGNSYMVEVPWRIMYEEENVHFDDAIKWTISMHGCQYIRKERSSAKKTNRRLSGVDTTYIKRNRGNSTKRKLSCSSSDEYLQGERNFAEKNGRRNVSSYGVRNTAKKRTRGESMRKTSHSTSHVHVQEKRNIALKNNKRNVGSFAVNSAQKARTCGKGAKRNNSYSSTDGCYVLDVIISDSSEANTSNLKDSDFCNGMAKSFDEDIQEKRTVGEVKKKRKLMSHTGNHIQGERILNVSHNKKSGAEGSGSRKIKTKPHSSDHFQGKQTTEKNSPSSLSFADFQDKERTEEKNPILLNLDNLKEAQCVNVQEKWTVGEVTEKRKLMSDTGNHIREERNLKVSHDKKSGLEGSGSRKIITKPHSSDHFQVKKMTEKNKPISVSFADFQDKERTEEKNPIPLNPDDFKEDQCVNIQEKRTVGEVIKKRKLMSDTGNHIREERNLNVSHGKKSGREGSGSSKIITKPHSSDHFQDMTEKNSSFQKSVVNEVYDLFLKNLKVIGESVVYKFGDNERVLYEISCKRRVTIVADSGNPPIRSDRPIKNNLCTSIVAESSDQSTRKIVAGLPLRVRVATEKQSTHPSTSFIPASRSTMPLFDNQLYNRLEVAHRVPNNMRKKLLEILSRPYSKPEHDQLWKEVSFRSAVLTHRDSRSGGSHRPGQMGRSLLDWNPDLNSEIDKVKSDPVKVLNLLRMLSFYIKKLPCGNICKPWLDDSLMDIIHGSA